MTLLAHQLRAPLSVISALAQGLARRADRIEPHDVRDRAKKIWHASRRLDELIATIMNYTRANAGGIVVERKTLDLKAVLVRVGKEQARLSGLQRCDLQVAALPDRISADPALIEQAFAIVVGNALRYSPEDSRVRVTGAATERSVTITVEDRGIGIPERDLPFVGQPFFRAANTRHITGTGLGLSLARHIVALHAGRLSIDSTEGQGTTVRVSLRRDTD